MTIAYTGYFQQKIAAVKPDVRSRLGQLGDETLRRVAIWVAGGVVAGGVLPAASNVGSEQHTWWGWLLIGAPLVWLVFLGVVTLTFGVLRVVVGVLRWSLSLSRSGDDVSVDRTAGAPAGLDASIHGLASAA
jgi:hypothetical protein